MDFATLCWASLVIKTVKIVQNISLECYMGTRFKQGSVKHSSASRSGHNGKAILLNNESLHSRHVTRVLEGIFRLEIRVIL